MKAKSKDGLIGGLVFLVVMAVFIISLNAVVDAHERAGGDAVSLPNYNDDNGNSNKGIGEGITDQSLYLYRGQGNKWVDDITQWQDKKHNWKTASLARAYAVDGDTIWGVAGNTDIKIRLLGIDAPEKEQPDGDMAQQRLHICLNKIGDVKLHYDANNPTDKHGRYLGRVTVGKEDCASYLLRWGAAWYEPKFATSLDAKIQADYKHQFEKASNRNIGLFVNKEAVRPERFREGEGIKQMPKHGFDNWTNAFKL